VSATATQANGVSFAEEKELVRFDSTKGIVFGDELAKPVAPPNFLSGAYGLTSGRPTALTGYAGSAKTWLAQDLALSVANGDSSCWGGAMTLDLAGRVMHIDYEMGRKLLQRRYQRLALARGIDLSKLGKRIGVHCFPTTKLTSDTAKEAFTVLCRGVALCVIDSLRAAIPGVDENTSNFRSHIDLLSEISDETNTVFLLLHHDGKDAKGGGEGRPTLQRMRGSSAIADALGASLAVLESDGGFVVDHAKASVGKKGPRMRLRLEDTGDLLTATWEHEGIRIIQVNEDEENDRKLAPIKKSAIEALKRGPLGTTQLREQMIGAKGLRDVAIKALEDEGTIARPVGAPGTKRPFHLVGGKEPQPCPAP
jgi:AAA domain